jgi:hypothetical protein
VLGASKSAVVEACSKPAFVASHDDGTLVVFCAGDDLGGDLTGDRLSARLGCRTMYCSVWTSDRFAYGVYSDGELLTTGIVPLPEEFFGITDMVSANERSQGPQPEVLIAALGRGDLVALTTAFSEDFASAEERHAAVLNALGLPTSSVGWGYRYLANDSAGFSSSASITMMPLGPRT